MAIVFATATPFEKFLAVDFPSGQPLQRVSSSQWLAHKSYQNVLIANTADYLVLGLAKAIPLAHQYSLRYAAYHVFLSLPIKMSIAEASICQLCLFTM